MIMRRFILTLLGSLAIMSLLLGTVIPVLATEPEPESVSLSEILIFNSLLVDNDFLAVVPYDISFDTEPEANIDDTYIFRIISPDGTTDNGTVLATPAYNGGYGPGIVSFYFESGMAFDEAYIFRVQQNPAYYISPQFWDFTIGDNNYSADSDQAAALKAKIIDVAIDLTPSYEVQLLSRSESGAMVLSTYGELYFLDAIPGLQNMCPQLFSVQLESPDYTKRSWSHTFADALLTKYSGTFIYDFMTGFAGLFSMETSPAMNVVSIILFAVLIGISIWKFKASMLSAFIDGYALLLLLMLCGFFSMIWAGVIAFVTAVTGGAILFFKRA